MPAQPNILLVFTDQQRFDTIAGIGSSFDAKTPNMDFLAQEGIVFENCYCPAGICSPSRASMMTGLYPSQVGMPGNLYAPCPPLSPIIPTMGNYFRSAGYETIYNGKWHMGGDVKDYGFEKGFETTHDATAVAEASRLWRDRDWLENERPFLHVVSFINPHDHYFYDSDDRVTGYKRPWKNLEVSPDNVPEVVGSKMVDWSEERWGGYAAFYAEQIEQVDRDLGELLHQFRTGGFYSNSWIIFTADHGDMAGEHNLPFKGAYMYEGVLRVPMIVVPPITRFLGADRKKQFLHELKPGRRQALSSHVDLLPTMMDIAGIEIPEMLAGRSLLPVIMEEVDEVRDEVLAEWHAPAIRMIRNRQHKYVKYLNQGEELYNLEADPHEIENIADSAEAASVKRGLAERLDQHITRTKDPFYDLDKHDFIFNPSALGL